VSDLYTHLVSAPVPAPPISSVAEFFARSAGDGPTVERAARAGFSADRLGYAFAGGYAAALASLDPALAGRAALGVTESPGGGHPRAIKSRLDRHGDAYTLTGEKSFVTLARSADVLLVVASVGHEGDKNLLRVARVPKDRAGITVRDLMTTPFAPEIPHAHVTFNEVAVDSAELLEGDGYADFVKPFRTTEDIHVLAAMIGYLVSAARAWDWPHAIAEGLLADLAALVALGACDPRARGVHVGLTGVLAHLRSRVLELGPHWDRAPAEARDRWFRDVPLLSVADRARTARAEAAWAKGSS
jgi:acyl-CoA dehydrogenase